MDQPLRDIDRTTMPPHRRRRRWPWVLGGFVVVIVALVALWDWNWFRPLVAYEASATLGRRVTIGHFDLHPGLVTEAVADDVEITNPDGFPADSRLARVQRLTVQVDVAAYVRQRLMVIPLIGLQGPQIEAQALPDGKNNWTFPALSSGSSAPSSGPGPQIGALNISDGHLHAVVPKMKADVTADIATRDAPAGQQATAAADTTTAPSASQQQARQAVQAGATQQIVVSAKGTYSGQPITAEFIGGALLSLRDAAKPYPIDLNLANGQTHVAIQGTLQQPLTFGGANVTLKLTGQDMAQLYPLTGIAIPQTPPYSIAGKLDYADRKIRFDDFAGRLGSSDVDGSIAVDPTGARPKLTADLHSRRIDMADLGGFIGSTPGRASTPGQTTTQRQQVAKAEASSQLLPTTPINMPKLRAADISLRYKGDHIEGRSVPFDTMQVALDIDDGNIHLHPFALGVGTGRINGDVDLVAGQNDALHTRANVQFRRVDLSRLMASTHLFQGQGTIGGQAQIDTTGNSVAAMLGNGDGGLKLFMNGGDLSALLVDLSGLQFGNAVLSALGVPNRAKIQCLITDFALHQGDAKVQTMLLSTTEGNTYGTGSIDLRHEALDMSLRTRSNHFTIGSLPTPINIKGTFKNPSIAPGYTELGVRGGAAIGLGVLLPPLALLPTIQLGLGEDDACAKALQQSRQTPG